MPWTNTGKAYFGQGFLCYWSSVNASFYLTLTSNNYVPATSHIYASAFSGAELSSTSFTAGFNGTMRISLTSRILNINQLSNQAEFQLATVVWSGLSAGTAAAMVLIAQSGTDAVSPIVAWTCAGGFPIITNNTNLTISFSSAGILNITD